MHDAARPLVTNEMIERVIRGLGDGWDGAVPVLPIADTVKRVDGEAVAETLDREGLVTAQTPQAFDAMPSATPSRLCNSVTKSTDCASLVEANGGRVRAVEGDRGCSR